MNCSLILDPNLVWCTSFQCHFSPILSLFFKFIQPFLAFAIKPTLSYDWQDWKIQKLEKLIPHQLMKMKFVFKHLFLSFCLTQESNFHTRWSVSLKNQFIIKILKNWTFNHTSSYTWILSCGMLQRCFICQHASEWFTGRICNLSEMVSGKIINRA